MCIRDRHKEHDSLVYVTGKRYWYWNSRGRSINALDYLIQIRVYGLVEAVHALVCGEIRQEPDVYKRQVQLRWSKDALWMGQHSSKAQSPFRSCPDL